MDLFIIGAVLFIVGLIVIYAEFCLAAAKAMTWRLDERRNDT